MNDPKPGDRVFIHGKGHPWQTHAGELLAYEEYGPGGGLKWKGWRIRLDNGFECYANSEELMGPGRVDRITDERQETMSEPSEPKVTMSIPGTASEYTPPPGTFYLAYRGSVAHGMYVPPENPDSIDDIDLMGFCFGDLEHYFGLKEWGSRGTQESMHGRWDVVVYEIRKAFSLLLQGNPNIMSMLWLHPQHRILFDPPAQRILQNRHLFAGKHVYNAFAGYAHAQLEKMESRDPEELREYMAVTAELKHRGMHPNHKGEIFPEPDRSTGEGKDAGNWATDRLLARLTHYHKKGENLGYLGEKRKQLVLKHGYDAKNAAHLIRLLRMCIEFMKTGTMSVYRLDAAELLDIKMGKWALWRVKEHAEELFTEARQARDASILPDKPNWEGAQRLLIEILSDHFEMPRKTVSSAVSAPVETPPEPA